MTKVAISGLAQVPGALYARATLSFSFHALSLFLMCWIDTGIQERKREKLLCCIMWTRLIQMRIMVHGAAPRLGSYPIETRNTIIFLTMKDAILHTKVLIA